MKKTYFQAIHQIICSGHWITDQVGQRIKAFEITEPQYNVLRILSEGEGRAKTVQQIQEGMVQRSSNVTRIVDKLVGKNYVERKECPSNRRKMDITLTKAGEALLAQLDEQVYGFHQQMMNNLTIKELETLKTLIIKLKK